MNSNSQEEAMGPPPKADKLFEPTVDQMVNDFDDEQTLDEEEQLAAREDPDVQIKELSSLQRESDMPIEELLRLYNCPPPPVGNADSAKHRKPRKKRRVQETRDSPQKEMNDDSEERSGKEDNANHEANDIKAKKVRLNQKEETGTSEEPDKSEKPVDLISETEPPPPILPTVDNPSLTANENHDDEEEDEDEEPSELVHLLGVEDDDEEEVDFDYYPEENADFKKTILVGENHQAEIPESSSACRDTNASSSSEVEDKLMWSPFSEKIKENEVEGFLRHFFRIKRNKGELDELEHIPKDDEVALKSLLESNYEVETALDQITSLLQSDAGSLDGDLTSNNNSTWCEEECRNFEVGYRLYGKNFYLIQTKVPSRTVPELVHFYYMWKKTERYDSFAAKQRLEKKKHNLSSLNPGLTEFMDKFLEEQQQRAISPRYSSSQSSSLQAAAAGSEEMHNLLIYADSKRHRVATPPIPSKMDADPLLAQAQDSASVVVGHELES